jgi:hypothetical protein
LGGKRGKGLLHDGNQQGVVLDKEKPVGPLFFFLRDCIEVLQSILKGVECDRVGVAISKVGFSFVYSFDGIFSRIVEDGLFL